jgi:hypothetical protein
MDFKGIYVFYINNFLLVSIANELNKVKNFYYTVYKKEIPGASYLLFFN